MRRLSGVFVLVSCVLSVMSTHAFAQSRRATGLIFLDQGQYRSIPPAPPPMSGPPPATVDLSAYGYFPEPGDQGDQGSCVGWAVAYGMKSYQKNKEFRLQGLRADFRFSPAFVYNQVKKSNGRNDCSGGSSIRDALDIIESQGALPMDKFGYDARRCDQLPTEGQVQSAWEYRIAKWMRVNVQSLAEMKAQIVKGFPVVVAMEAHQAFADWTGGGVYNKSKDAAGASLGGHALVVVGYADQLKAFKVLNSWGKAWGDGGYAWIDYATFQSMTLEGYVTIDIFMDRLAAAGPVPTGNALGGATDAAKVAIDMGRAPGQSEGTGKSEASASRPSSTTKQNPGAAAASRDGVIASAKRPSPAGTDQAPSVASPPSPKSDVRTARALTTKSLSEAVRSTTEPKGAFNWKGFNVMPYSVWLELPDALGASINRVEYWFNHPTFKNPKKSISGSSIFIAKWQGYGCINDAKVIAFMKDGSKLEAPFDLCEAQTRF